MKMFDQRRPAIWSIAISCAIIANASVHGGQSTDRDAAFSADPKVEIIWAVFGTGRGKTTCVKQIREIIKNKNTITTISTPGLNLKNRSGQYRNELRIGFRVDGNNGVLVLKNNQRVNIYEEILASAAKNLEKKPSQPKSDPASETIVNPKPPGQTKSQPMDGAKSGSGSPESPEKPVEPVEDPNVIVRKEFITKPKAFDSSLATARGMLVGKLADGQQVGFVVDVIVQASEHDRVPVDFARGNTIGEQMRISMDEAIRAVRARYPQWEKRSIRFSFGEKYSDKDGGSAGATFALLTLSLLEGFEIDPDLAVTGDILVNWKIKRVGAIPEKIRGAALDNQKLVAIPEENIEGISDLIVRFPIKTLWTTQIFSVPDLQSLIQLSRTDRPDGLKQAIGLFGKLQAKLHEHGQAYLSLPSTRTQLERIVVLAPNHQSAKHLLLVIDGKQPTRLSRSASLRALAIATQPLNEMLWENRELDRKLLANMNFRKVKTNIDELSETCHMDLIPLLEQFDDYADACKRILKLTNRPTVEAIRKHRNKLLEELRQTGTNREMMEQLFRE